MGLVLAYLVAVPVALLVVGSFRPGGFPLDRGFTLAHYASVYGGAEFWRLLAATLAFALGSSFFALSLGIGLAWLMERSDLPGRGVVRVLILVPMAMPPILLAIAWAMLLSPRIGFINLLLVNGFGLSAAPFNVYSLPGLIFVQGLSLVPTAYLFLAPAFRNMDPSLEEAAQIAGAGNFALLRRVLLPLLWPAILAAWIFLLIVSFVVFDIPGALGMPARIFVLSTEIYYEVSDSPTGVPLYGEVSALSLFFLLLLFVLGYQFHRLTRQSRRYHTVSGKAFRPRLFRLGAGRHLALAAIGVYFVLAVILPLVMLLWTSLMPYQAPIAWASLRLVTLANHLDFLRNGRVLRASAHSLVIALTAASVVTALSLLLSWLVLRLKVPGARLLDALAFAPLAIPGVIIGVALVYVYLSLGNLLPIYGTIWIIAIAYVTQYLSFGSRVTHGIMLQLHPDLEEAGLIAGGNPLGVLRKITLKLMQPALAAVWLWVFAHALRELSSALMLQGRDNFVVPTLLWDYWSSGEPNRAAAVGIWLTIVLVVFLALWQFLAQRSIARD